MKTLKSNVVIFIICSILILSGCITVNAETIGNEDGNLLTNENLENNSPVGNDVSLASGGTITASDHWILRPLDVAPNYNQYYSGAEGYTTSSTYHRTSVEYLVSWESVSTARKWGTGQVKISTGYVKPPYANLTNAFKSAVYYQF